MYLFSIDKNNVLTEVREKAFAKERELQLYCENNLNAIFGLRFVRSEFALNNFRIDTLAYDVSQNAFVIIEYKKDKNFSVIDQGFAYLSLLLNKRILFLDIMKTCMIVLNVVMWIGHSRRSCLCPRLLQIISGSP